MTTDFSKTTQATCLSSSSSKTTPDNNHLVLVSNSTPNNLKYKDKDLKEAKAVKGVSALMDNQHRKSSLNHKWL